VQHPRRCIANINVKTLNC